MCNAYRTTKSVVDEFLKLGSFTRADLHKAIKDRKGVHRVDRYVSLKNYLEDLEYKDIIKYNYREKKFYTQNKKVS